jgi:ATP-dependent DNA ligase
MTEIDINKIVEDFWCLEPKLDGLRAVAFIDNQGESNRE